MKTDDHMGIFPLWSSLVNQMENFEIIVGIYKENYTGDIFTFLLKKCNIILDTLNLVCYTTWFFYKVQGIAKR